MTRDVYVPRAGSMVERAVQLLGAGPMSSKDLAQAIGTEAKQLPGKLNAAIAAGAVTKSIVDGVNQWSIGDGIPLEPPEAPGEGAPIRRHVVHPSTQPSAAALASANPFGLRAATMTVARALPHEHRSSHAPKRLSAGDVPPPASTPTRFGLFSDSSIVIERDGARFELSGADAAQFLSFLQRLPHDRT